MAAKNLIKEISAIPSWVGYETQGYVALYYSLLKIKQKIRSGNLAEYELQLEGAEDFSIKKGKEYISVHQVKLNTFSFDKKDKAAFVLGAMETGSKKAYIHLSRAYETQDFISETDGYIDELLQELGKPIREKEAELSETENKEDFIIVKNIKANKEKASSYSILKYVMEQNGTLDGRTKEDVEAAVEEARILLNERKSQLEKYADEAGKFCDYRLIKVYSKPKGANDIRKRTLKEIKKIILKNDPSATYANDELYLQVVFKELNDLLKVAVTDAYEKNLKSCCISFEKIYEAVITNYTLCNETEGYKYWLLSKTITSMLSDYVASECTPADCESCTNKGECNIYKQIDKMVTKPEDWKETFFHLLMRVPEMINNMPHEDTIREFFIPILEEYNEMVLDDRKVMSMSTKDKKICWLTVNESRRTVSLEREVREAMDIACMKLPFFEYDYLVTPNIKEGEVSTSSADITRLTEKEQEELHENIDNYIVDECKNIIQSKKMTIIDRDGLEGLAK